MAGPYDAVVVGAGPAGLSAAAEIAAAGRRCLLVEQGVAPGARDRHAPEDVLSGVGGAGLFSDGKHSFFPAATELWRLPDRARLATAYERTRALLVRHGVAAPPLPADDAGAIFEDDGAWRLKRYPSLYAALDARMRCIADLHAQAGEPPLLAARVDRAARERSAIVLEAEHEGRRRTIETKALVVATGRLSPRSIRSWLEPLGVRFEFRRLELGVRIETSAAAPLFAAMQGVDPKYAHDLDDGTRLLTFCTCRDGEVVLGSVKGLHAISGRADGPPTGRSSVGLLARVTDERLARAIEPHLFAARRAAAPLAEADALLEPAFGAEGAAIVSRAIERFVARFPELAADPAAVVHVPCIEGVGDYPITDGELSAAGGVWIAGDAGGRFRGIVASMVSGRYAGLGVTSRSR